MDREDKNSDEEGSVDSLSREFSPRENIEGSDSGESLIPKYDEEGSDHHGDDTSGSDSENQHTASQPAAEAIVVEEVVLESDVKHRSVASGESLIPIYDEEHPSDDTSGSDSENQNTSSQPAAEAIVVEEVVLESDVKHRSVATYHVDMGSDSDSETASKMHEAAGEVANKECGSDSEVEVNKMGKDDKFEKDSNSDMDSPNKVSQNVEVLSEKEEKNSSDSENDNDDLNAEKEGISNFENVNGTNQMSEDVSDKESGSDSDHTDERNKSTEKLETENVSGSEVSNKMIQTAEEVLVSQKQSDSDSENEDSKYFNDEKVEIKSASDSIQTAEVLFSNKQSDSDSENEDSKYFNDEKVETKSDSDSDKPHKMTQAKKNVLVEKESNSDSENLDKKNQTVNKIEGSDSESENIDKSSKTADEVPAADKQSDSDDPETPENKKKNTEKLENDSDSDSDNTNKSKKITQKFIAEEERGGEGESPITLSRTVEEFVAEERDETEDPDKEAMRGSSGQSTDHDRAAHSKTWPGKAAALKNFVKMKGAFAVSNVFRRLSGGKDGDGLPVDEDKNETSATKGQLEELTMKGRITLYTRLGCQQCREVRSRLYEKRLTFTEINVDIYPSRKLELENKTGSSSVPWLYFNDFPVGGLAELKAMEESGKLDEKIEDLINEEPSSAAPLPPVPGEDDVSGTGKVDELASIVKKMKEAVGVSDRFYKMRRLSSCFLGSEAVDFLSQDQCLEREEAIEFGRKLANNHFFQHALEENVFEDGNHVYRFLEDDPLFSTQCYNMTRGINEFKPKPIIEIASRLRFLSFALFEAYVSEDGRHVDYKRIDSCAEFQRYLRVIEELQRVDLKSLSREETLAFFINLYNMMAIHAILTFGHPAGASERRKFFGDFKYVVGGCAYSLSMIQNGILRANQRLPYNLSKPFGPKDKRLKVALSYAEPLVHFALVYGTRSGPALRCYSPANIDQELLEAARSFLRTGGVILDAEAKVVSVSKILRWYSADFGKNEAEVIKHAANYLDRSDSQELLDLQANNQLKVTYQQYDWGLNS